MTHMKLQPIVVLRGHMTVALVLCLCRVAVPAQQDQGGPNAKRQPAAASIAALDRMIAAGKSRNELAQHLFDTHGCKGCHTIGKEGKLGFTSKGKEKAQGFDGCISTLKAMSIIAKVPEDRRSATQRLRSQRFEEFGCATCHSVSPGKVGLTEVGEKLAHLHLGCVEVQNVVAGSPASRPPL